MNNRDNFFFTLVTVLILAGCSVFNGLFANWLFPEQPVFTVFVALITALGCFWIGGLFDVLRTEVGAIYVSELGYQYRVTNRSLFSVQVEPLPALIVFNPDPVDLFWLPITTFKKMRKVAVS